ncbi:MAG: type I restriction-modification system subunit M [Bacteroidales bacterium]|nr:type I restriction-modification system subunit M [Bacteroidales bacterium]
MSKDQERAELHRTIWAIANDLRGSVDGWDFKNYILGFLFYRFISEDLTAHLNATEEEAGNSGFNYATDVTDDEIDEEIRRSTIDEKGYFIYPSELFQNVAANAETNADLNISLAEIFKNIEASAIGTASEQDMKGLFSDIDVNSPKLGGTPAKRNELLAKIMKNIGQMDLGGNLRDAQIDAFGDAYEFLMTMYASNAGKSGGEFFTPQEVAELLARIACDGKNRITKVYDPACGSGSLLLKFSKILGPEKAKGVSFYGQEINITTYNLCRINMFLHHVPFNQFDIQLGDTLIEPKHLGEIPFDAIVSNPPYSTRWAGDDNPLLINDDRFSPAGVLAPKTKADLAFTMHILYNLSTTGTAAIVEFPGVLYRPNAERKIRQYLIENNYVDTVIQLPENLFFGVSIGTCIIVLKKSKADNSVLFVDARCEYVKNGNKNLLTENNLDTIYNEYHNREDVQYKAKLVSNTDILANECNLSVSSYVEQEDKRERIDILSLNQEINNLVTEGISLRERINNIITTL